MYGHCLKFYSAVNYLSQIIQSITLSDLEVVMTDQSMAFSPPTSSQHTLAKFKNPFGFPLQLVQSAEDITLITHGNNVAEVRKIVLLVVRSFDCCGAEIF